MPKAISYIRFSSAQQGGGSTEERQRAMIETWLSQHPKYEESNLSAVDKGRSAYSKKHLDYGLGGIKSAIDDGSIKEGDVLLVEAIDRLGRFTPGDMLGFLNDILSSGVEIVTLEDNATYGKDSFEKGSAFVLMAKIQQAHQFSSNLSRRIKASYDSRKAKAINGEPIKVAKAVWLDVDGKLKEPQAAMVREAIRLYRDGKGSRAVVMLLREKFPDIAPKDPKSVKRWLQSPALIGAWGGIDGVFQPLVSPAEFVELEELFKRRTKTAKAHETYLLSGLVKCKLCGSSFHYRRQKPTPTIIAPRDSEAYAKKPYIVYGNCSKYLKSGSCENNATWPYEVLQHVFSYCYFDVFCRAALVNVRKASLGKELNDLEARLAISVSRKQRLVRVFAMDEGDEGLEIQIKDCVENIKVLQREVAALKDALEQEPEDVGVRPVYDFLEMGSEDDRRVADELNQFSASETKMRSVLLQYGFRIEINGKVATSPDGMDYIEFTLFKRRQQFSCYFVRAYRPEDDTTWFEAVGKDGKPLARADSEAELVEKLEALRVDIAA